MGQRIFPLFVPITALDRFSAPLAKMGGQLEGIGKKAERVGKKLTLGLTVPLTALAAISIRTGFEYQQSQNKVQAITGETAERIEALEKSAEATLGAAGIPSSMRKTSAAMAELARGGRSLEDVQSMLPAVVELAVAAMVDEAVAAKATADVLDAYRFSGDKAAEVTDLLAFAANRGEQEFAGLVEGITAAATKAREFGQDLPGEIAALNTLADAHFEGAAGANLYGKALTLLARPTGQTAKALKAIGISSRDLFRDDGQLRNLDEILVALNRHGATAKTAIALFGTKAGPALAALLGPGTEKTRAFRKELEGAGGAAEKLAKVQLGGGVGALEVFQQKWEAFLVTISRSGLLEGLGAVADALGRVLELFRALPEPTRRWVVGLGVAAAALGPMLVGFGNLLIVGGKLVPLLLPLGRVLLGSVGLAFSSVGLVIAGVVAAGAALFVHWDILKTKARDVGNAIRSAVPDWVRELFATEAPGVNAGRAAVGRTLGTKRLDAAATRGAAGARANVSGAVRVEFSNTPAGTRIRAKQTGDVPLDVDAGYVLAGGLAG